MMKNVIPVFAIVLFASAFTAAFEFEKEPISESPCIAVMVHSGQSQVVTEQEVEALLKKGAER